MYKYLLSAIMLFTMAACQQDELPGIGGNNDPKTLQIDYTIEGADVVQMSRGIPSQPQESKVSRLLTLIFEYNESGDGLYIGHADSEGSGVGTSKVTMPGGNDARNAYSMIVLGNFNTYSNIKPADLDAQFTGKKLNDVVNMLLASIPADNALGFANWGHPMSAIKHKGSETNSVSVVLQRMTCRVDIENYVSSSPIEGGTFEIEGAQIWNVRQQTPITSLSQTPISAKYIDFGKEWSTPASGDTKITAQLYAFSNFVALPTQKDKQTTCLIVKGRYNGSTTSTYYRLNVCDAKSEQQLLRNHIYTIKIMKVTGDGSSEPGAAYDSTTAYMSYTINDWDNSYMGIYTFDADGNGLAASSREISFSNRADQSVKIDLLRYKSSTHPLPDNWTSVTATVEGNEQAPNYFAATVDELTGILTISTRRLNDTDADYVGVVTVKWGTIKLPITVTQLNAKSQIHGMTATPHSLLFDNVTETKQVILSLYGVDLSTAVIKPEITCPGGWVDAVTLNTTLTDTGIGQYVYDIATSKLPLSEQYQTGSVRFNVTQGWKTCTALISLTKTGLAQYKSTEKWRRLSYYNDTYGGYDFYLSEFFKLYYYSAGVWVNKNGRDYDLVGLSDVERNGDHLYFSQIAPGGCMYEFNVRSMSKCDFVSDSQEGKLFTIEKTSEKLLETGEYSTTFLVSSRKEYTVEAVMAIIYDDGTKSRYIFHQKGVIDFRRKSTHRYYYYGTASIMNELWLDRNIGAKKPGFYTPMGDGAEWLPDGIINDPDAAGAILPVNYGNLYCPFGFSIANWKKLAESPDSPIRYKERPGGGWLGFILIPHTAAEPSMYLPLNNVIYGSEVATFYVESGGVNSMVFFHNKANKTDIKIHPNYGNGDGYVRCVRDNSMITAP
ncbi:MAG: hypothetical protein RR513_10350 [Muribaculaceae bacterium]